jgi:hypothetical protein
MYYSYLLFLELGDTHIFEFRPAMGPMTTDIRGAAVIVQKSPPFAARRLTGCRIYREPTVKKQGISRTDVGSAK